MYYTDLSYIILVLPAVLFSLWASRRVNSTFNKYKTQYSYRGITGADAARMVLDINGLQYVRIECIGGNLTDHFDPSLNVIRLSEDVYSGMSTAAIGVACHEVGHAIQHSVGFMPIKIRNAIIPITNIGSKLSMPLIIAGLVLCSFSQIMISLAYLGVVCFSMCAVFQLVTLPTEFDASKRALVSLETNAILEPEELYGAKKVLSAAALTYVAALLVSITQILRLLIIIGGRRR